VPADALSPEETSTLGVLGFTAQQEELYRVVLRNPGSSAPALAALVGAEEDEVREHLARFVGAGIVDLRGEVVLARPPAEAIARLLAEESRRLETRGAQLDAVRGLLPTLSADHLTSSAPKGRPVALELVDGDDLAQLVRSLSAGSTGDLLWLRPDQWKTAPAKAVDGWIQDLVRAGRRSRAIYPARVIEEAPAMIRERAEAGEHIRILAEVPSRLAIMGSTAALLTERFGEATERRLVVRQPALIGALTLMFEGLWEKAMAVPGLDGQRYDEGASDRRLLLSQLAEGAKDEQIARALGLSVRTVRRRVAELLDDLGAESRFQAGVEAVRRGWT
jgi:DNA-binding transcriptional ArsR family regulator